MKFKWDLVVLEDGLEMRKGEIYRLFKANGFEPDSHFQTVKVEELMSYLFDTAASILLLFDRRLPNHEAKLAEYRQAGADFQLNRSSERFCSFNFRFRPMDACCLCGVNLLSPMFETWNPADYTQSEIWLNMETPNDQDVSLGIQVVKITKKAQANISFALISQSGYRCRIDSLAIHDRQKFGPKIFCHLGWNKRTTTEGIALADTLEFRLLYPGSEEPVFIRLSL